MNSNEQSNENGKWKTDTSKHTLLPIGGALSTNTQQKALYPQCMPKSEDTGVEPFYLPLIQTIT